MVKQESLQWERLRRYLTADTKRTDNRGDRTRPGRAAHLAHARFDHPAGTRVRARVSPGRDRMPASAIVKSATSTN